MQSLKPGHLLTIIGSVAVINLIARLIGFVREIAIGIHYGTSFQADAIITAYTIPNFFYLAVGGALTTAFISTYVNQPDQTKNTVVSLIFTYIGLTIAGISIMFFLFPSFFMKLFFQLDPVAAGLTSDLFRIMSLGTFFLTTSMLFTGYLNANRYYKTSAFAPLYFNVIYAGGALIFQPLVGIEAYSWSVLAGAVVMYVYLLWDLRKKNLHFSYFLFKQDHIRVLPTYLWRVLPILLGGATIQLYFLLQRVFASGMGEGTIAALNYSSKLIQIPQSILITAVTTVLFPLISKMVTDQNKKELQRVYVQGIRYLLMLMLPVSTFVYFYSNEIISLVFEYGAFNQTATAFTADLLMIFVLGMTAHAINVYLTRFYYAHSRNWLAVFISAFNVFIVNGLIIILFAPIYGAEAIAWGMTISGYTQLFILLWFGWSKLGLKPMQGTAVIKILVSTVTLCGIFTLVSDLFDQLVIQLFVGFAITCLCLGMLVLWIEKNKFIQMVKKFLRR